MLATDMDSIFDNWATQGLDYYIAARVSWDPALTFDAVLDDYCRSGFGAGAEQVKKYFLPIAARRRAGRSPRAAFPQITPETIDAHARRAHRRRESHRERRARRTAASRFCAQASSSPPSAPRPIA